MAGYQCFHLIFEVYLTKLHCHEHIIFLVGVVFADKLLNSVNMLYMVLSHTGSLYWSTGRLVHQSMSKFKLILPVSLRLVLLANCFY